MPGWQTEWYHRKLCPHNEVKKGRNTVFNLITSYLPEGEAGRSSLSSWEYSKIKQDNLRQNTRAALSGLPKTAMSRFNLFSADWVSRYLDAQAASPRIIRNYLEKVENAMGTADRKPARFNSNFKGIVDEVLEKSIPKNETAENPQEDVVPVSTSENEDRKNDQEFHGIVGEIFDKYA
jgi:hypothetical protein